MSNVTVKGFQELQQFLETLPAKMEANIMRSALRAGAKVIAEEAKRLAPVASGDLRDSIRVSVRRKRGKVVASVTAGDDGPLFYWRFVEFGTASHWISVKQEYRPSRKTRRGIRAFSMRIINNMAASGSLVIGENFVGASVAHPGARAKPFMRPALDTQEEAAVKAVGEQIKKRLTKQGLDAKDIDIEVESE